MKRKQSSSDASHSSDSGKGYKSLTCHLCHKKRARKRCSVCHNTYYCSRECQRLDFQNHRGQCSAFYASVTGEKVASLKAHSVIRISDPEIFQDLLTCPLSLDWMVSPVWFNGNFYEEEFLRKALHNSDRDPIRNDVKLTVNQMYVVRVPLLRFLVLSLSEHSVPAEAHTRGKQRKQRKQRKNTKGEEGEIESGEERVELWWHGAAMSIENACALGKLWLPGSVRRERGTWAWALPTIPSSYKSLDPGLLTQVWTEKKREKKEDSALISPSPPSTFLLPHQLLLCPVSGSPVDVVSVSGEQHTTFEFLQPGGLPRVSSLGFVVQFLRQFPSQDNALVCLPFKRFWDGAQTLSFVSSQRRAELKSYLALFQQKLRKSPKKFNEIASKMFKVPEDWRTVSRAVISEVPKGIPLRSAHDRVRERLAEIREATTTQQWQRLSELWTGKLRPLAGTGRSHIERARASLGLPFISHDENIYGEDLSFMDFGKRTFGKKQDKGKKKEIKEKKKESKIKDESENEEEKEEDDEENERLCLKDYQFSAADLSRTTWHQADFHCCNFSEANMKGATFLNCEFFECEGLPFGFKNKQ